MYVQLWRGEIEGRAAYLLLEPDRRAASYVPSVPAGTDGRALSYILYWAAVTGGRAVMGAELAAMFPYRGGATPESYAPVPMPFEEAEECADTLLAEYNSAPAAGQDDEPDYSLFVRRFNDVDRAFFGWPSPLAPAGAASGTCDLGDWAEIVNLSGPAVKIYNLGSGEWFLWQARFRLLEHSGRASGVPYRPQQLGGVLNPAFHDPLVKIARAGRWQLVADYLCELVRLQEKYGYGYYTSVQDWIDLITKLTKEAEKTVA